MKAYRLTKYLVLNTCTIVEVNKIKPYRLEKKIVEVNKIKAYRLKTYLYTLVVSTVCFYTNLSLIFYC